MIELWRRLFGRRWAVVLVIPDPAGEGLPVRMPWRSQLGYGEAVNILPVVERSEIVAVAVERGAWLDVAWADRLGFV